MKPIKIPLALLSEQVEQSKGAAQRASDSLGAHDRTPREGTRPTTAAANVRKQGGM